MSRNLFLLACLFLVACSSVQPAPASQGAGEPGETLCTLDQRNADFCTQEYNPVCGWNDPAKIQCIRYPCARTYGNACEACKNDQVISWTPGECPP
ncbi:MAG TPA: hypothetical protein VLJ21_04085 [Candidatus Binatia bacterium]|nr:hypothetical protein [Candidatus Binatia bacterium]